MWSGRYEIVAPSWAVGKQYAVCVRALRCWRKSGKWKVGNKRARACGWVVSVVVAMGQQRRVIRWIHEVVAVVRGMRGGG